MDLDPSLLLGATEVSSFKVDKFNKTIPLKKSAYIREKEAADKKAKEEEDLAAQAYLDFVQAFDAPDDGALGGGGNKSNSGNNYNNNNKSSSSSYGSSNRTAAKGFVRAGGEGYNPLQDRERERRDEVPSGPGRSSNSNNNSSVVPTGPRSSYNRPNASSIMDDDEPTAPKSSGPPGKKKRDMDNFLEQLKRDQKEREDRLSYQAGRAGTSVTALAARENAPVLTGSYDSGDPLTTNVHVAGLPSTVTEQSLGMFFAKWGPVGSVKIMWPRLDGPGGPTNIAPVARRQLGGFVAYLRRPDAERAAKDIDGREWNGGILKCSWGKAVPLPRSAIFEIEGASTSSSSRDYSRHHESSRGRHSSDEDSRTRHHSSTNKRRKSSYSSSSSRSRSRSRSRSPARSSSRNDNRNRDNNSNREREGQWERTKRAWPELDTMEEDKFLRTIAGKVKEHGEQFELVLREREKGNPKFAFFRDSKLPAYHFFKMLLDSNYSPPNINSTIFLDEGKTEIYSSDSAEDSERERSRKGTLGRLARRRFECMLRGLTSTREKIARGMCFALEHADAAAIIVDILIASLTLPTTPVPRKIARLHLISDILHNSANSISNAWLYRTQLETKLSIVFDHLGEVFLSFPGRMKAEQFRMQVINIIDVWEKEWMIFEPSLISDLKRRLSGESEVVELEPTKEVYDLASTSSSTSNSVITTSTSKFLPVVGSAPVAEVKRSGFTTSSFKPSGWTSNLPDTTNSNTSASIDVDGEDIDGEDLDGIDVDGEDLDGVDLDGEIVEEGRKVRIEESEDGEAMQVESDDDMF